ncbi:hypothetical protein ACEWY4_024919 [Coilia grayii]|uniref:C1q domain-containing protein n=1 Tax=Coilia grayii TaxID=363190 RepID=A0ABD1IW29_9TELE
MADGEYARIFTAPVKGVYFFTFTTLGINNAHSSAMLTKNGERMDATWDGQGTGESSDTASNSVVLPLGVGDKVSTELYRKDMHVYDNEHSHNTFSGFLLFPL